MTTAGTRHKKVDGRRIICNFFKLISCHELLEFSSTSHGDETSGSTVLVLFNFVGLDFENRGGNCISQVKKVESPPCQL